MTVLLISSGKRPEVREITGDTGSMEMLVGGKLEINIPYIDPVALICNEDGPDLGMPRNRMIFEEHLEELGVVYGDFFLCGTDNGQFTSLTEHLIEKYTDLYYAPEAFIEDQEDGTLIAVSFRSSPPMPSQ